ncbi:MAG: hypothetical protein IID44_14265 [Planctomycetes bacterium]|nr:hypothetical protein [Planctomycetota bacterium]
MTTLQDHWSTLSQPVVALLDDGDDTTLWEAALNLILSEASFLARHAITQPAIVATIGRCSHWLRPHQARWTADGGFAWPSGYGGVGYSRTGAPEFDWSISAAWNSSADNWQPIASDSRELHGKNKLLTFRVTIPAHTIQHRQAAIPTEWMPGSPVIPKRPCRQIYGFRQIEGSWQCTATSDGGRQHYEQASNRAHQPPS